MIHWSTCIFCVHPKKLFPQCTARLQCIFIHVVCNIWFAYIGCTYSHIASHIASHISHILLRLFTYCFAYCTYIFPHATLSSNNHIHIIFHISASVIDYSLNDLWSTYIYGIVYVHTKLSLWDFVVLFLACEFSPCWS